MSTTPLLTDCDIKAMRETVTEHFTQRATIARLPADTDDGMGGQVDASYVVVATDVPCSAYRMSMKQQEAVRHITTQVAWNVMLVGGTDVRKNDRVTVSGQVFMLLDLQPQLINEVVIPALGVQVI